MRKILGLEYTLRKLYTGRAKSRTHYFLNLKKLSTLYSYLILIFPISFKLIFLQIILSQVRREKMAIDGQFVVQTY